MNFNTDSFKGLFIAFYSCYDNRGEVSPQRTAELAARYASTGVKGLYICGSTGEGMLLSVEERQLITRTVIEAVGDRLTIIVHVGAPSTRDCIRLARHAEESGAHAVSAVPSIYYRLAGDAVQAHWNAIISSAELPFILYNIPSTTGFELSNGLLTEMARQEKVIGVKNSTLNAYQIWQYQTAAGKPFLIYNGSDEQYLAGRIMGACGGIGGSYGVMPELFVKLEHAYCCGDIKRAQRIQNTVNRVIGELYATGSFIGAAKALVRERYLNIGQPRMPIADISAKALNRIGEIRMMIERELDE